MIVTSDKPWRRHHRTAWRWVLAAVVVAAVITAGRWCWYFGPSVVARPPALPGKIVSLECGAGLDWRDFPTSFERVAVLSFAPLSSTSRVAVLTEFFSNFYPSVSRTVEPARSRILADIDRGLLDGVPTPSGVVYNELRGNSRFLHFHLDPPLTAHSRGQLDWEGVILLARLADGQRVWVLEIARPVYPTDMQLEDRYRHRQILIFDEQLGKVLARSGWYEDLWNTTFRPTARAFFTTFAIALLVATVPIVLALRRASVVRRRFLARRCIACDYNFAGHGDGLLTCPECGQVQWPVDMQAGSA
ncbi:MAG TPA: hypothetical protein VK157_01615 [Phycisphaerales bacterium]|nr:hypothetical protein [Phycisphaerales bacterium]